MFVALDQSGNHVSPSTYIRGSSKIVCPCCGKPVIFKCGQINAPHFAHIHAEDCDSFCSDMSWWHYNAQERFDISEREVVIQHNGVIHRADVCIGKTVIEFQNSQISIGDFDARNEFYVSAGYQVIWVFNVDEAYEDDKLEPLREFNPYSHHAEPNFGKYIWRWPPKTFYHWKPTWDNRVAVFLSRGTVDFGDGNLLLDAAQVIWAIPDGGGSSFRRIVLDEPASTVEDLRDLLRTNSLFVSAKRCIEVEPNTPLCPCCGIPMALRTAKTGANSGSKFWGCRNFPKCKMTRPIIEKSA